MSIKNSWLINKITESLNKSLQQLNNEYSDKITSEITLNKDHIKSKFMKLIDESDSDNVSTEQIYEIIIYLILVYLYGINRN